MGSDDLRYFETFYGIYKDDWTEDFGSFSNHHKVLVKEYISEGCSTTSHSTASETHKFLYPHHIKKTYFIEGVIDGQVTFASSGATVFLCAYRVTVCKVHENTDEDELFSTGWKTVNDTLGWNFAYGVPSSILGEEGDKNYPFSIDAWQKKKLTDKEHIYVKIESTCSTNNSFVSCAACSCSSIVLMHSNDATWEDLKIVIPFKL